MILKLLVKKCLRAILVYQNYEVSSELLIIFIKKSQSLDVLGGRLTGAGFGVAVFF